VVLGVRIGGIHCYQYSSGAVSPSSKSCVCSLWTEGTLSLSGTNLLSDQYSRRAHIAFCKATRHSLPSNKGNINQCRRVLGPVGLKLLGFRLIGYRQ